MKILALADTPDRRLWELLDRDLLSEADLILSAGDLPADYLSFLTCFTHAPILYVHGNHDTRYAIKPPEGCICVEDDIAVVNGIRVLGLGGSMRYKPGSCMYSEEEMKRRITKLKGKIRKNGGFDILLTHAPVKGLGDQPDLPHQGFECFGELLDLYRPSLMIHGHVHQEYTSHFIREREYHGIRVINAGPKAVLELQDPGLQTKDKINTLKAMTERIKINLMKGRV